MFGADIDFAQLAGLYSVDEQTRARYSRGKVVETVQVPIQGQPDLAKISASYYNFCRVHRTPRHTGNGGGVRSPHLDDCGVDCPVTDKPPDEHVLRELLKNKRPDDVTEAEGKVLLELWDKNICPLCGKLIPKGERVGSGRKREGGFCSLECYAEYHKEGLIEKVMKVQALAKSRAIHSYMQGGRQEKHLVGLFSRAAYPELRKSGILPSQEIRELIGNGKIRFRSEISDDQIQPASIDLRLGDVAYRVPASFLPSARSLIAPKIKELQLEEIDLRQPALLRAGSVYIAPLIESLALPTDMSGKSEPEKHYGSAGYIHSADDRWRCGF